MKIRFYLLFILLNFSGLLYAQEVKLTASASRTEVGTDEQFEITFAVNGNAESFSPPSLGGNFQVLSGPNQSTSMESINGNTTMSSSISYIIMAAREGEYAIGPAVAVVNGKKLTSNVIKLKVVKGRAVQQTNAPQGGPDNSISPGNTSDLSKLIFIKAVVDKSNVYLGQQLTVSYRLYTRVGIEDSQPDKLPDLNGFYSVDIKRPQQAQWHVETYKGERFNVTDIKETVLFPEHAGNITIDPLAMDFIVRAPAPARDIMDQFFGSFKEEKYKAKSAPVVIRVKPLPDTGKPDSFTGAVGNFSLSASVDKTALKANESLNYNVKVTGSGNIKLFEPLKTSFPPDFEKYDPKTTDTVTEDLNGVTGSRIYNYLLIPRHQGNFTIEPVKFSYFNPATGKYVTLSSKSFTINVAKGITENNVTAFSDAGKQDIKKLTKDIRYIKKEDELAKPGDSFFGSFTYFIFLLIGPAACLAAFIYRNRMREINSDVVLVKSRKAGKMAAKHLASAQLRLQTNDTKAFYEDIFKGLYGYLSDKLNINYANLDRENITVALATRSVDSALIKQLMDTLDLCEMARYAPVTHISEDEVYEKAKSIINDIEAKI